MKNYTHTINMSKSKINKKGYILVFGQHFWPENFRVSDIAVGLVNEGYTVDVVCGIPNYPAGKYFDGYSIFKNRRQTYKGISIIRVPEIPRGNNTNFRIFLNYMSFPFFAMLYLPLLAQKKYDRILIYQLSPVFMAFPAIILGKIKKIRTFIYICDFWPHSLFSILRFRNKHIISLITKMSYWHYRQADGIICVFKGIQTRLIDQLGIKVEKTLYIPQVAEKVYERQIHDIEIKKLLGGGFKILFAGNINPAQSFETVISAAKIVIKKGYENIKYIILGDGMSKKWLINKVKEEGLSNYFIFLGLVPVEEVPKYQTVVDALIVALSESPLFEYGIPAKVNSYLPSGKPIIGAMNGEGKRLINASGSGICVSSGDAKGLAETIIKIHNMTYKEREKMGKKGRDYHFKHFERNYNLQRLINFVFNDKRIIDKEYPRLNKKGI